MKKVSIILPIYNMEQYIERCLNTLINQTYKNIEIVLINDGSLDSSLKICNLYKKNDKRIIVVDKENGGVSSARNTGLKTATGDYIMFVDPDDWIDINTVELCVNKFNEITDLDVVVFPYIKEFGVSSVKVTFFDNEKLLIGKELEEEIYYRFFGLKDELMITPEKNDQISPPWGKLIKKEIINNLEFVDINDIGAEDTWFNIHLFSNVRKVYYTNSVFYHYNKENSLSITKSYNEKLLDRRKKLYKSLKNYVKENELSNYYYLLIKNRITFEIFVISLNIVNSNLSFFNKYKKIKTILKDELYINTFKNLRINVFDFKWKIYFISCKYRISLIVLLMTILAKELRKRS